MSGSGHPVLEHECGYTFKFPRIVADKGEAMAARMRSDVQVIDTNRCATSLKGTADLSVMLSRFGSIIEDIEPAAEILHNGKCALRLRTFLGPVQQFCQRDGRDRQVRGILVEAIQE